MTLESVKPKHIYRSESAPTRWPAFLDLLFQGGNSGCKLRRSAHQGPLYIQKAFYPEGPDHAYVYLLHPPGGIVSGDSLSVSLSLEERASVLLTTPGATRLYRARKDIPGIEPLPQKLVNRIDAKKTSFVEWLPAETIIFNGAHAELVTEFRLDTTSQMCGWEIICLGLQASQEKFLSGRVFQSLNVYVDDVPVIIDRLQFDANSPYVNSQPGLQRSDVYGSFVAGPFTTDKDQICETLISHLKQYDGDEHCGVTMLSDFLVIRYLGECSDQAKKLFIGAWEVVRPMLSGRAAVKPRIWAT